MIQVIEEQIVDFDNEIEKFTTVNKEIELLQTIPSCGKLIASMIIAEIKDINRFRSSSALAKYCGIAPRTHDSASSIRHYIDFKGNRKLNHAFYRLALSQVNPNGSNLGRKYFSKKIESGKSNMHALRCLKRRLVDVVFQVLKTRKPFAYEKYV